MYVYPHLPSLQIESLEAELEDVHVRSEQYEEEIAQQSQEEDFQLVDSQMKDYYRLQAKAGKKSATLTLELERVSSPIRNH